MLFKPHAYTGLDQIREVQSYVGSTFLAIAYAAFF
jgi:hypothetical protein